MAWANSSSPWKEHYRQPDRLNARLQLHRRFSKNPYGWLHWVFDRLELVDGMCVLDTGCGTDELWLDNQERLPLDLQAILIDFSQEKVKACIQTLWKVSSDREDGCV